MKWALGLHVPSPLAVCLVASHAPFASGARGYAMPLTGRLFSRGSSKGGVFAKSMELSSRLCNALDRLIVASKEIKGAFLQKSMADVSYLRLLRHTVFVLQLAGVSVRVQSDIFKGETILLCHSRHFPLLSAKCSF